MRVALLIQLCRHGLILLFLALLEMRVVSPAYMQIGFDRYESSVRSLQRSLAAASAGTSLCDRSCWAGYKYALGTLLQAPGIACATAHVMGGI